MSATLIGFIIYLVVVVIAGAMTYRLTNTQDDFLLAGRKLNVWVATMSERASSESAWLLLGLPGAALVAGLIEGWAALGCLIGITLSWWIVAKKLREETEAANALTLPEYLATRFGEHAQTIRLVASLIILFFYAFYVAAQFSGAGKVLNVTFGIDETQGMLLGAGIIIAYTMAGGFFAVAWTDFIQAFLMLGTLVILPIAGFIELASLDTTAQALDPATTGSLTGGKTGLAALGVVVSGLSWGFGYFGQPHTLTRYMSIADPEQIRVGRWIAIVWGVLAFVGAICIGIVGIYRYGGAAAFADQEQIMPALATDLLPGWLAGIFISGAIAAMMSTADSQLLVGTSAVAEDMIHRTLKVEVSPERLVSLSRVVAIGLGLSALLLAWTSREFVFGLVSYAWGGLGASFGPVILLTLYWKRLTGPAVVASMLTGTVVTIIWSEIDVLENALSARASAFLLALAVALGVSLLAQPDRGSAG